MESKDIYGMELPGSVYFPAALFFCNLSEDSAH